MYKAPKDILKQLILDNPVLEKNKDDIQQAFSIIRGCYKNGGKILVCGNGGSAADSEHIVGELMKGFLLKRPVAENFRQKLMDLYPEDGDYLAGNLQRALPAISLTGHICLSTAFGNDVAPDMGFAQQVYGYGKKGDVLIVLSTSGNSKNVVNAAKVATSLGMQCIGMTGKRESALSGICSVTLRPPSDETYRIQEFHVMIYHAICAMLEADFFKK